MDGKQKTPSVIARLMGLDELPPPKPLLRQHKVLSDDYLRKTASIGQLEKRSIKDVRVSKVSSEKLNKYVCSSEASKKLFHLKGLDDMLEDLCCTRDNLPRYYPHPDEHQSQLLSGRLSSSTYTSISDDSDSEVCKKLDKIINQRIALRSVERVENRQTYIDLKPNSRRVENCARNLFMPTSTMPFQSDSDYMYCGAEIKRETDATSGMEPHRRSSRVTRGASHQTDQFRGVSRVTPDDSSPNVSERISCQSSLDCKRRDRISYPFPGGSLSAMEARKQNFERWKATKNFQEVEDYKRCTLGEMFIRHDGGARPKTSYMKSENHVSSSRFPPVGGKLELGSPLHFNRKYGLRDKYIRNLPRLELVKRSSIATESSNLTTVGEASVNGSCSGYKDTTIEQRDLKNKAPVTEDSLEPRVATGLASEDQQHEIDQLSPDSVLEPPFEEESAFASEFCNSLFADLSGLAGKLELLESRSEETNSECSGVNVSSDEDSKERSLHVPQYNKKPWGAFRLKESRDFSYLVDVLDEASSCDWNLDNLYEKSRSMEFPLNPSLFEALEKKYGKQTSWMKSERRLLFDRINSGLKDIMDSYTNLQISGKSSLRRRFCRGLRRNEIEEELWMLLVNQEKEVSKDLSEKAVGKEMKWLELEEDVSVICREIEDVLYNELAEELYY